jgi:signal transduction histidine kinase
VREAIFEPFMTTKGQRGTGLGLAVTRNILQQHGGRIQMVTPGASSSSDSGLGTLFVLSLPSDRTPAMDMGDTRLPRPTALVEDEGEFE